jgi:hypothetical protein
MSRRRVAEDYYDPRQAGTRASQSSRDVRNSSDQRETGETREQPIIQDLRDRRYPREQSGFPDSGEREQRAEIGVARPARDPRDVRDARDVTRPRANSRAMDPNPTDSRDRSYLQTTRDPRDIAASGDIRSALQHRRDTGETRYLQERRPDRDEWQDPTHVSPSREYRDPRTIRGEQQYPITDQSTIRNDFIEQSPLRSEDPFDSTLSAADSRLRNYSLPVEGISFGVLSAYISRHLGLDATCRPGLNREARLSNN